jgi:hypothetical protein
LPFVLFRLIVLLRLFVTLFHLRTVHAATPAEALKHRELGNSVPHIQKTLCPRSPLKSLFPPQRAPLFPHRQRLRLRLCLALTTVFRLPPSDVHLLLGRRSFACLHHPALVLATTSDVAFLVVVALALLLSAAVMVVVVVAVRVIEAVGRRIIQLLVSSRVTARRRPTALLPLLPLLSLLVLLLLLLLLIALADPADLKRFGPPAHSCSRRRGQSGVAHHHATRILLHIAPTRRRALGEGEVRNTVRCRPRRR